MARKVPNSDGNVSKQNREKDNEVRKSELKKQNKRGLFQFGRKKQIKKSRENLREVEEFVDDSYEQDGYDSYGEDDLEFEDDANEHVAPTEKKDNPREDKDVSKSPHIDFQRAESIYDRREMDQSVFLYVNNDYFPVIQQHYNKEFSNIRTIGTSALNRIESIFSEKAISKYIMLFVLNQNEVSYIKGFLNSLRLEQIQPNVLNILVILDISISIEELLTTEHQRKFIQVKSINQDKTPITKSILNKLISVVVNDQPSYIPPEKPVIAPKKVNHKSLTKDINRLNNNDLTSLKQAINEMKANSYDSEMKKELMGSILGNTDIDYILGEVEKIPHLKLIKAVEDEVEEQLELIKHNPRMKEHIEGMITRKLLLATMRTSEMEEMISEIIDSAVVRIESVDSGLRDYNRNAVMELKDMGGHEELLAKREEIKVDISKRFSAYKGLIQLISNSANSQAKAYQNTRNQIGKVVTDNRGNISEDIVNVTTNQLQIMDNRKDSYLRQVTTSHGKMVEALDLTNKLLESYKILVSLDDVVINSLLEENEVLKQMQPVKVNVETGFKSNGVNIVSLPGSGMLTIFDTFLTSTDLIIYYGGRNLPNEILEIEQYTIEDFLSSSWDRPIKPHLINLSYEKTITNPMQIINNTEYDIRNKSVMERLISKIDYVSASYSNIYVIYEPTESEIENVGTNTTFRYFIEHLRNVVIWSPIDRSSAVMTSMINSILPKEMYSVKIFLNKVSKNYQEHLDEYKSIVNKPLTTLIIPYISNIEGKINSGTEQISRALKNIKNRMR